MRVQGKGPRKEVATTDADIGKSGVLVEQPEAHEPNATLLHNKPINIVSD